MSETPEMLAALIAAMRDAAAVEIMPRFRLTDFSARLKGELGGNIDGGACDDVLTGGDGEDELTRSGTDTLPAGAGNDLLKVNSSGGNVDNHYSEETWNGGLRFDLIHLEGTTDFRGARRRHGYREPCRTVVCRPHE